MEEELESVRTQVKRALEARGKRWKESKWNDWIKEVVATVIRRGRDRDDAVAAALGFIVYGLQSKDEMRLVAATKDEFKRQLAAEAYGVPPAICDLLFAEYVAEATGLEPVQAQLIRLMKERDDALVQAEAALVQAETVKRERDDALIQAETALVQAETALVQAETALVQAETVKRERDDALAKAEIAEDSAGLRPQSLWDSAWRLNQPAYDLPNDAVNAKISKSSRSTSRWPAPDEVARWDDFRVTCPTPDILTTERFNIANDGMRDIGQVTSEADLIASVLTPQLNTIFRHGVQHWFCPTAYLHLEMPVTQGVIADGMVFRTIDNSQPVLPIEIKHPKVYCPHDDMGEQWARGKVKCEKDLAASPIRQIYTYMCLSECTYGILSTYQRTWFVRRKLLTDGDDEHSVLQFSKPLLPTSSEPTLAQAIVYVLWLALKTQSALKMPRSAAEYISKIKTANAEAIAAGKRNRREASRKDGSAAQPSSSAGAVKQGGNVEIFAATRVVLPLEDIDVEFKPVESFSGLNHGVAHRMDVHGYDSVIKLVDASKDHEGAEILAHEVEMYSELRDLWGDAIPSMVCSGSISLGREMLAITYEGISLERMKSFSPSILDDIICQARRALAVLHKHGVVHGDIALRNIVRDENSGSVKLIDLGSSYHSQDQSVFRKELELLNQVLMILVKDSAFSSSSSTEMRLGCTQLRKRMR